MYLDLFEPKETALASKLLESGDLFVDVGAHIGWFTTIGSQCVGDGRVVAFEPYPTTALVLKENLKANHCNNVVVIETALGEHAGTISLSIGNNDSGSVTAVPWSQQAGLKVPVITLDEVDAGIDLGSAALFKIDVEGWESHVLRGGERVLSNVRRVMIEINRPWLKMAGSSQKEVIELLQSAGFTNFLRIVQSFPRRYFASEVFNVLATRPSDRIDDTLKGRPDLCRYLTPLTLA
jgi:FkbM family methyltransferase